MATDVPVIPLYQKPTYLVYKTKLRGLVDNPTLQGPTWNTENWTTSSVALNDDVESPSPPPAERRRRDDAFSRRSGGRW